MCKSLNVAIVFVAVAIVVMVVVKDCISVGGRPCVFVWPVIGKLVPFCLAVFLDRHCSCCNS